MPTPSSIAAIVAGATLLQAANGSLQALLPLRMEAQGLSTSVVGWVASAYGLGFAAGCLVAPSFVRRIGHIRAFAALAAVVACATLAMTQAQGLGSWSALRVLMGISLAGLFTVIESWISARAATGNRGRTLAAYMVCTKFALVLAPLVVVLGDVRADGLLMLISALWSLSLIPVAGTLAEAPPPPRTVSLDLRQLFAAAPSAAAGCFAIGLVTGPVMSLAPLYGLQVGLGPVLAGALLLALQGGSLVLQWPLGWLSDRTDRRKVIAGVMLAAGACSVLIMALSGAAPAVLVVAAFALWGGFGLCAYAICVAHAADLVPPERVVATVSGLLICWAVGSGIGPIPGAAAMSWLGPDGLFLYAAAVCAMIAAYVALRVAKQGREVPGGGFVNLQPTSPASGSLGARDEAPPQAPAARIASVSAEN